MLSARRRRYRHRKPYRWGTPPTKFLLCTGMSTSKCFGFPHLNPRSVCPTLSMMTMENNDLFAKIMTAPKQAAKNATKKWSKVKAPKINCPNCEVMLRNKGALALQCKYKNRTKPSAKNNQPRINFGPPQTASSSSRVKHKQRPESPKRPVKPPKTSPKKKKQK